MERIVFVEFDVMSILFTVLRFLGSAVSLYTFIIFIRVLITWIPSLAYSKFGRFLASITDPYLNIFRKIKFLRVGNIDFSPILAIGALVIVNSVLSNFIAQQRFSLGILFAVIIGMCWSLLRSFIGILIFLLIIRLIFNLINKDSGSIWTQLDQFLTPIMYKVSGIFFPRKYFPFRNLLACFLIILIVVYFAGNFLFGFLAALLYRLPF